EDLLDDDRDRALGEQRPGIAVLERVVDLHPRQELEGEDGFAARVFVDEGIATNAAPLEVARKAAGVLGLDGEVELAGDGAIELRDEPGRRVDPALGDGAFNERREAVQKLEIAGDGAGDAGALDLDDDLFRTLR